MKKYFTLFFLIICFACNTRNVDVLHNEYSVITWKMEVERRDINNFMVDTIYNDSVIYFDNLFCRKKLLDSVINLERIGEEFEIDNLIFELDKSSMIEWKGRSIKVIGFTIRQKNNVIPKFIIYNKDIGILIKKYHGNDKALIVKKEKVTMGKRTIDSLSLDGLVNLILKDTIFFPLLPIAPPLPCP